MDGIRLGIFAGDENLYQILARPGLPAAAVKKM
jgi:hypothetical protein